MRRYPIIAGVHADLTIDRRVYLPAVGTLDLARCPYYRGEGTCMGGCHTEPACITERPAAGWPSERHR